jgi:hypothetical protein
LVCVPFIHFSILFLKALRNFQMNSDVCILVRSLMNLFLGFLSYNIMVSKPVVLVFLLVVLIITSQFEWKQQLVNELESTARNQKHVSSREELVKDQVRRLTLCI